MASWNSIRSEQEWEQLLGSNQRVIVFKHSTRCSISMMARSRMDALVSELSDDIYEVNVIEDRPISNRIASDLSVRHESPQLLIVEDGKAVFHTSHNSIRKDVILPEINP